MQARSREWLKASLNKKLAHWDCYVPGNRDNCVGLITTAREFYDATHTDEDMLLWIETVDKAEAYVENKHGVYTRTR